MRAGACVLAATLLAGAPSQQPTDLAIFQEALELGRTGDPTPYTLHMNAAGTGVAGMVYTPFIRVAMASHAAHGAGRELAVSDLPDWLTEPVLYVALRWYCVDSDCALPQVPIGVKLLRPRLPPLAAAWVSRDFDLLHRFGADKPSPDTVLIAAFPVSAVLSGSMVEACVRLDERTCNGRGGVITQQDLEHWK